ncbi:MAG: hypothetical protein LH478_05895, partial [Chitinophagaceae bacterium]|nr:hypothetical protein [Chitinophagaceae bacterium]
MKSFLLLCCVLLFGAGLHAQQYQFIYLQTDNKQPFYVRINEKLYSSSAAGYLVIPRLKEGTHSLSVGFPKNEWPIQNLDVKIAGKDLGFLLKYFQNNKWGLFNFQTMEVVTVADGKSSGASTTSTTKNDQFSNILADVVNTPSIKEDKKEVVKTVVSSEIPKAVPVEPLVVKTEEVVIPVAEPGVEEKMGVGDIRKLSSATDNAGLAMVYVDKLKEGTDTIKIFIEASKTLIPELPKEKDVVVADKADTEKKSEPSNGENGQSSPKFIDITLPNPNEQVKAAEKEKEAVASVPTEANPTKVDAALKPLMINSDCKQFATDADFLKIRKKMTAEKDDDGMVKAATKMFKQKCYSTDQVKNLSVLFLKDEGKYKFFDAAYPY